MNLDCSIKGVIIRKLNRYTDSRGWLTELFREDDLPSGFSPVMGYVSMTHPGIVRGPHEHVRQTDGFAFLSGSYKISLWDNRPGKDRTRVDILAGEENPLFLVVPEGVVHAYQNIGESDAIVLNFPNQLYAGWGKQDIVDEIRHEEIDSEFKL